MFRETVLLCCVFFVALTPFTTLAINVTPEQRAQMREFFEKNGLECMKEVTITEDDVANLRARKLTSGENAPCFLACIMKRIGVMDDKGMLQNENGLDLAKQVFSDPEDLKMMRDYLTSCSPVNDKPTTDGEKGCERAFMSYKCMIENAAQFEFMV